MKAKPKPQKTDLIPINSVSQMLVDPQKNIDGLMGSVFSGLSINTLRAYKKSWEDFTRFLGFETPGQAVLKLCRCTPGEANAIAFGYRAKMTEDKLTPNTINSRLAAIKSIMDRFRIMGMVTYTLEVKGMKVTTYRETQGPGKEPIVETLKILGERKDPIALRDLAIIRLLYTNGLRRSEVSGLDVDHVEFEKDRISIKGKGRTEREYVTIGQKTKAVIEAWLKVRPDRGQALFINFDPLKKGDGRLSDTSIYRTVKGYGLGRPHGLRHTAITEALENAKGDVRSVQKFSRHKDIRTLLIYDDNRKDVGGDITKKLDEDI